MRSFRRLLWVLALAILPAPFLAAVADAGWLSRRMSGPQGAQASEVIEGRSAALFETAAAHVRGLPEAASATAIAVGATQEGHWRFANSKGDPFTAATPDELKRAMSTLLGKETAGRPALYLSEHTVFLYRERLAELPKEAALHVIVGGRAYPLARLAQDKKLRLFARVAHRLVVEIEDRATFDEAIWQLARPVTTLRLRQVALEPQGPGVLTRQPRLDPATKKADVDRIAPAALPAEIGRLASQIAIVSGRVEGERLVYVPSSGREGSLSLKELAEAVKASDAGLMILDASSPRQPVGRNWLWLKVELKGLGEAMKEASVGDFLSSLASGGETLAITARLEGDHVRLSARPGSLLASNERGVASRLTELTSRMSGNVTTRSVDALLLSADRQSELSWRLVPYVPSDWQIGYLALMGIGLLALGPIRRWWAAIWPPELREDFAGPGGHIAAEGLRRIAMTLLFMPLAALPGIVSAFLGLFRR